MTSDDRWAMPGPRSRDGSGDPAPYAYDNAHFDLSSVGDEVRGGSRPPNSRGGSRPDSRMGSISSDLTSPTLPMTPNTERKLRERALSEVRQQLTDATNIAGRAIAAGAKKGLNTLTQPMEQSEFGWFDVATALISVGMFFFDVVSDSLLAHSMYSDPATKHWFLPTLLLLILPLVVVNGFSLYWYWFDEKVCEPEGPCHRAPKASTSIWVIRVILHLLLQASILRYLDLIYYGYKSRRKGQVSSEDQHPDKFSVPGEKMAQMNVLASGNRYRHLWIHAEKDASNVDLLASLLQDAPQLIFQLYIMAYTVPAQAFQGEISETLMFQILSVGASLVAMSWSVSSFAKSARLSEPRMANMSPAGLLLLTLAHFCSIAPQVLCFALFASKYLIWFVVVIACHWLATSFLVIIMIICCPNPIRLSATFTHDVRKGACSRLDDVAFSASFGLVLLYTFMDVGGASPRIQGVIYHFLRLTEEACMIAFWYLTTDQDMWYHWVPVASVPGFFVLGCIFFALYYFCSHPDRKKESV